MKNGKLAFDANRCCQCGVCLASCKPDALQVEQSREQYDFKILPNQCTLCQLCVIVCPAHGLPDQTNPPDTMSRAKALLLAYATDPKIRKSGSSGGVTRALLHFALSRKLVDAAYTLMYPDALADDKGYLREILGEAEGVWLNDPPELFRIPTSLYRPVLWGERLRKGLPSSGRVLLIGLPCQLKGAKLLLNRLRPKLDILSIAIFCRKNKSLGFTRYFQRESGVKPSTTKYYEVTYRGGGWPGSARVMREGAHPVEYFFPADAWNLEACRYCVDPTNMYESDLTVTDPWGIVSPSDDAHGQNLVMVWTKRGQDFMAACAEAVTSSPVSPEAAAPAFDYPAVRRKGQEAAEYMKGQNLSLVRKRLKTRVGEILFRIMPRTSRSYRLLQSARRFLSRRQ